MGGRYYSPAMKNFISACNINEILYNIGVLGGLNAYAIGNPIDFPVNSYNIFTSIPLTWDPHALTKWQSFWNGAYVLVSKYWHFVWDWGNTISGFLNPISTFTASVAVYVALFSESGRAGLKKDWDSGALNPFNQNAEIAVNVKVVGFYKGSTVIRQDVVGTSSIFGTIWLRGENSTTDLNHEWGHSVQERILGTPLYFIWVAAPSVTNYQFGDYNNYRGSKAQRMYYSKIWERTADWFGGIDRENYDQLWYWKNFRPW